MFRVHDPEVGPDSPGAPLPPVGVLVSANREQLWVGSLQQDIDVRVVLEEWDGQPLLPESWDEEAKARLYLRGYLSIDMGSAGKAVSGLRLSGGVGNYEVRVYARYRDAVVKMYEELFNQHKDPLSDEFQREKRKLEGVERYLIQLWRDSLRPGAAAQEAPGDQGVCAACDETLAAPDVAARAVPDLGVADLTAVPDFAVAAGFGAGFTGADAETPPVACGFVTLLGTWARKGIMA
jgi:hypothetical protein